MSSRQGGSRYPSAFGHTPTYRSYAAIIYGAIRDFSRDLTRDLGSISKTAGISAFKRGDPTSLLASTDFDLPTFAGGLALTEIWRTASEEPLSAKTSPPLD